MPTSLGNELSVHLCDEEIAKLSDILDSFPSEDSMTLEMLDGFFTGLHCCPTLVPPSRYIHIIYGNEDEDDVAPFEDEEQFYSFFALQMRYWNGVGDRLRSGAFTPFLENTTDAGTEWSVGFLQGVLLAEGNFESMIRDEDETIAFMPLFMLAFGNDKLHEDLPSLLEEEITPEMREELLDGLPLCAMFLYSRFRDCSKAALFQPTSSNKVGRNDHCPCGSGKNTKNAA